MAKVVITIEDLPNGKTKLVRVVTGIDPRQLSLISTADSAADRAVAAAKKYIEANGKLDCSE